MKFLPGDGWVADTQADDGDLLFGGRCPLKGAVSPNTGLFLTQFACANIIEKRFWIPGWNLPLIHFLYSWQCKIHEGRFSYRYAGSELEVIEYCKGVDHCEGFPYENYPSLFDEVRFRSRRMSTEDQSIVLELNRNGGDSEFKLNNERADLLSVPSHQFGGVPYLVDPDAHENSCLVCGREMPIVASIGNKSFTNNEGFSGNDFVQVIYWACANCQVVSALNFCE